MSTPPAPLPLRAGVAPSSTWLADGAEARVLERLVARFPAIARADWAARMARGEVVDRHGTPLGPDSVHHGGLRVYYYRELPPEAPIPGTVEVLYRDAHLLVVDKPHFLPVIPAGAYLHETLLVRLRQVPGLEHLAPLHRLDRDTAGLVLFSVNPASRAAYSELFPQRRVHKVYEALAPDRPGLAWPLLRRSRLAPGEPFFRMREVDGAPNAETLITRLDGDGRLARYRLEPHTGRKHQLRVHLAALGIPIVNDRCYPELLPAAPDDPARPLKLLARTLRFTDPLSGAPRRFDSHRSL
ncbi:pseudouridine synthase [Plasticicumulans lactativorans]|nr:pseudouridine synthase [Plasticicumulans lactativorans]